MTAKDFDKALALHQQGKTAEALEAYLAILKNDSKNVNLLELVAVAEAQLEQYQAAEKHLQTALTIAPNKPSLLNNLGNLHHQQQANGKAETAYLHAIKADPSYANAYNNLGKLYFKAEQIDKAEKAFIDASKHDKGYAEPYFNLALIRCQQDKNDAAIDLLKKTIAINPNHARALGQLGQLYLIAQQYSEAIEHLSKRLEIQPQQTESWHSLGQAQVQQNLNREAIESFKECLAINSKHPQAHHDLAVAYTKLGDHAIALNHYHQQVEANPLVESYYNIGVLLMYQERNKEALEYLQHALKMQPENYHACINIASIYLKKNQTEQASEYYRQALTIEPDNKEAQHILAAISQTDTPDRAPNEYLSSLFDQYAFYYDQHLTKCLKYNVPEQLLAMLKPHCLATDAINILDLGCGTGLSGSLLKPLAKKLIGIDISNNMILAAKEKNLYDQLIVGDICDEITQFSDIDLIIAADVFTYIGKLDEIITKCCQALNKKGLLTFSVEQSQTDSYELQASIRYAHSKAYLEAVLTEANLTIIELNEATLREQNKKPVLGYIVLVQRQ
jgi:predicted TPR repeat methyltransferase